MVWYPPCYAVIIAITLGVAVATAIPTPTTPTTTTTTTTTSRAARGGGESFKNRKRIGEIGCCESRMTKQKH